MLAQPAGRLRPCSSGMPSKAAMAAGRINASYSIPAVGTGRRNLPLPFARAHTNRRIACRIAEPRQGADSSHCDVDFTSDPQHELANTPESLSSNDADFPSYSELQRRMLEVQLGSSPSVSFSTCDEEPLLVGSSSSSSSSSSNASSSYAVVNSPVPSRSRSASPSRAAVVERPAAPAYALLAAAMQASSSSSSGDDGSDNGQPSSSQPSPSLHPALQQPEQQLGQQGVPVVAQQQHQQQAEQIQPSQLPVQQQMEAAAPQQGQQQEHGGIPHSIFIISMVSMALTSASCVFNTLLPIYMVTELKMSMQSMGMFEGVLEAFSYVVRMFSGVISDRMTSRKAAITLGFAMGACAKLGMSFATSVGQLFVGKAIDRLANGVQAAPRDALIGDLSPAASRSACFGFAQSMRKWGSFMGAGLAFALMKISGNNYRLIFLLAAGVSAMACVAFATLVPSHANASASSRRQQQQDKAQEQEASKGALTTPLLQTQQPQEQQQQQGGLAGSLAAAKQLWADVRSMSGEFWRVLSVIALYGLGHINESLLEARAIEVGFGKAESTLVVALLCFAVFLCAYPLGKLDDKYGHNVTFAVGMASLVAGDLVLLTSGTWPFAVFAACLFWGAHWAVVQGPMLSIVVGLSPAHLKGMAFGIFYTVMALTAMVANTVYGRVWHQVSANAAFGLSAAVISLTMLTLPVLLPPSARKRERQAAKAAAAAAAQAAEAGAVPA